MEHNITYIWRRVLQSSSVSLHFGIWHRTNTLDMLLQSSSVSLHFGIWNRTNTLDMLDIKLQFGILKCSWVYCQYHFKSRFDCQSNI